MLIILVLQVATKPNNMSLQEGKENGAPKGGHKDEHTGTRYVMTKVEISCDESVQELDANTRLQQLSTQFPHRLSGEVIYREMLLFDVNNHNSIEAAPWNTLTQKDWLITSYPKSGK